MSPRSLRVHTHHAFGALTVSIHARPSVVLGEVVIKSPYRVEDCSSPGNAAALERVKKVLSEERKRL